MYRLFIFFIIVVFASCTYKVRTIYDVNYDFSKLSKFCWQDRCEMTFKGPGYIDDSLLVEQISNLITEDLIKKGFEKDTYDHNFLIDVHIVLKEKQAIHHTTDDHAFEEGEWISSDHQNISPEDEVYNYIEGSFIVDVIDFTSGTLVWRSAVIGAFEQQPEINERDLQRMVKMALEQFPPE